MANVKMEELARVQTVGPGGIGVYPPVPTEKVDKVSSAGLGEEELRRSANVLPHPGAVDDGAVMQEIDGAWSGGQGGGADIDLGVTDASVGDYLKVKSVDEEGKPTAWESESVDIETIVEDIYVLKQLNKDELSWAQIQQIVQSGNAQDWFNIGDQLEINWTKNGTVHKLPFDVVSFDSVLKYGESAEKPGLWLQSHYAGDGVQFSASNALYVATEALPAGTYHFTIGTNWGTHCVAGKSYQFTTTKQIPAGGQIMVGRNNEYYTWGAPDQAVSGWRVHTFESSAATTPLDSNLGLTEGTDGTDLGTTTSSIKYSTSGINNLQRAAYGYNRWSQSANRQYYNSAAAAGAWWTPQNPFDRAPQQLASLAGYMSGFDADFLAVLGKIKVTTALNTVSDSEIGTTEDTYDTFFLPSLEQEYIVPQLAGVEGAYWPYWKERLELDTPQKQGSDGTNANHIRYAYDARTSAQTCRLRSARRGHASNTWFVYPSGYAYYYGATSALRGCPACVIC